ncbi:Gag-like protein [Plakobranchus ocellatus]|uniref:Gag-like protein n=1 Tax=Plakobranchus ocellatus TaxID=259542 RepID=A0AAV3Y0K2_9GAST|nr:Gag-like protein [Plakobranchus ocellatus]
MFPWLELSIKNLIMAHMSQRGEEASHRGSSWDCLCCQQEKGGGPSYFDVHVSLCGLVTIKKKNYSDQLERICESFKIHRELKSILGDETIEVTKHSQAKKLGAIATFLDIPVTVSPNKSLNSSNGVICSRDLQCFSEEKMMEELSGVTHARRIKVRRSEDKIQTDTVSLPLTARSRRVEFVRDT